MSRVLATRDRLGRNVNSKTPVERHRAPATREAGCQIGPDVRWGRTATGDVELEDTAKREGSERTSSSDRHDELWND